MRNLKRLFFTVSILTAFSFSAFAKSGFEFILNVPIGMGIGIPPKHYKDENGAKGKIGFSGGVTAQLGYMAQVSSIFGISILGELGYYHDTLGMLSPLDNLGSKYVGSNKTIYYSFDSFQIGLLPKFNIGNFSIGIGGGVKIPISGKRTIKALDAEESVKLNRSDIVSMIYPDILGYVKGSLDYSILFMDNLAFNIGLYLGYDIMKDIRYYYGIFDIGVELGLKFGARVD